ATRAPRDGCVAAGHPGASCLVVDCREERGARAAPVDGARQWVYGPHRRSPSTWCRERGAAGRRTRRPPSGGASFVTSGVRLVGRAARDRTERRGCEAEVLADAAQDVTHEVLITDGNDGLGGSGTVAAHQLDEPFHGAPPRGVRTTTPSPRSRNRGGGNK